VEKSEKIWVGAGALITLRDVEKSDQKQPRIGNENGGKGQKEKRGRKRTLFTEGLNLAETLRGSQRASGSTSREQARRRSAKLLYGSGGELARGGVIRISKEGE